MKNVAMIVAAGNGVRMKTDKPKQFLDVAGEPVIAHTLRVFQDCDLIDEIVIVVADEWIDYTCGEIVERYGISKAKWIVEGGEERCGSVYKGLQACDGAGLVVIHDAVRPFVTEDIIRRGIEVAEKTGSAVCGVPSRDTVRIVNNGTTVCGTPDRSTVWLIQTPQVFSYELIRKAYDGLFSEMPGKDELQKLTDDAMVLERTGEKVSVYMGDYRNIKLTTVEDLRISESFFVDD